MATACLFAANDQLCPSKAGGYLPGLCRGPGVQLGPRTGGSPRILNDWGDHASESSAFFWTAGQASVSISRIEASWGLYATGGRHTRRHRFEQKREFKDRLGGRRPTKTIAEPRDCAHSTQFSSGTGFRYRREPSPKPHCCVEWLWDYGPACRHSSQLTQCGSRYWLLCGCPFGL